MKTSKFDFHLSTLAILFSVLRRQTHFFTFLIAFPFPATFNKQYLNPHLERCRHTKNFSSKLGVCFQSQYVSLDDRDADAYANWKLRFPRKLQQNHFQKYLQHKEKNSNLPMAQSITIIIS